MSKNPYVMLSLPFFLIGLVVVSQTLVRGHRSRSSLGWPIAEGTVGWAQVEERKSIDGDTKYIPRVEFTYEVEDLPYSSSNHTFGRKATTGKGYAEGLIATYANKPVVDVYYNPKHPEMAVLLPGDTSGLLMDGSTGGVFAAIGMYALWRGRRLRLMAAR